jgi:hypothetical protein
MPQEGRCTTGSVPLLFLLAIAQVNKAIFCAIAPLLCTMILSPFPKKIPNYGLTAQR